MTEGNASRWPLGVVWFASEVDELVLAELPTLLDGDVREAGAFVGGPSTCVDPVSSRPDGGGWWGIDPPFRLCVSGFSAYDTTDDPDRFVMIAEERHRGSEHTRLVFIEDLWAAFELE